MTVWATSAVFGRLLEESGQEAFFVFGGSVTRHNPWPCQPTECDVSAVIPIRVIGLHLCFNITETDTKRFQVIQENMVKSMFSNENSMKSDSVLSRCRF